MENASKALIIAGAILLSILLISLGLMVYNTAKSTADSVNLNEQEIQVFNSKFTSYERTNVSGSQINALIQTVISSNQAAKLDEKGTFVTIYFTNVNGKSCSISGSTTNGVDYSGEAPYRVSTGVTQSVALTYNASGIVTSISVGGASSTSGSTSGSN